MIRAFARAVRQTEQYPAILDELQLVLVVSPDRFFRELVLDQALSQVPLC